MVRCASLFRQYSVVFTILLGFQKPILANDKAKDAQKIAREENKFC